MDLVQPIEKDRRSFGARFKNSSFFGWLGGFWIKVTVRLQRLLLQKCRMDSTVGWFLVNKIRDPPYECPVFRLVNLEGGTDVRG